MHYDDTIDELINDAKTFEKVTYHYRTKGIVDTVDGMYDSYDASKNNRK